MLKAEIDRRLSSTGDDAGAVESREYELKLIGSARDIGALKTRLDRHIGNAAGWRTRKLRTVYFDTVDRALETQGVAWRVRKVGRRFEQCVKVTDRARGILGRHEWETPVSGGAPDRALLPLQAARYVADVEDARLQPLFATEFQRRLRLVDHASPAGAFAQIEVAIDKGHVEAGARAEPIHEVEFELKRGHPRDLFDLVLAVTEGTGLRPSPVSKSARGHRLATGADGSAAVFAQKLDIDASMTVSDSLAGVFRIGLNTPTANEPVALAGRDPEGVHQMRVAVRRMRTALTVFADFFNPASVASIKDDLKWVMDTLGPARDWDVFLSEIAAPVEGAGICPNGRAAVLAAARAERDIAYNDVRRTLESPRYARIVLRLFDFTETRGWLMGAPHAAPLMLVDSIAPGVLSRAHKKAVKAGRNLATLSLDDRHRLRIRVKKLRYAVEFLQNLYAKSERKTYRKRLARLQDRFGHLNDVAVAERLFAALLDKAEASGQAADHCAELRRAAGAIVGWHARGLADGEQDLLREWNDYLAAAPFWPQA